MFKEFTNWIGENNKAFNKRAIDEKAKELEFILRSLMPDGSNLIFTFINHTIIEDRVYFYGQTTDNYSTSNVGFIVEAFINGGQIKTKDSKKIVFEPHRNFGIEVAKASS